MTRETEEKNATACSGSVAVWLSFLAGCRYRSRLVSFPRQPVRWRFFLLSFLCGLCPGLSPPFAHAAIGLTGRSPLPLQRVSEIGITEAPTIDEEVATAQKITLPLAGQENSQILGIVESENMGKPTGEQGSNDDDGDDDDDDDDDDDAELPASRLVLESPSEAVFRVSTETVGRLGSAPGWTGTATPGGLSGEARISGV
jgi:hypothetical protein